MMSKPGSITDGQKEKGKNEVKVAITGAELDGETPLNAVLLRQYCTKFPAIVGNEDAAMENIKAASSFVTKLGSLRGASPEFWDKLDSEVRAALRNTFLAQQLPQGPSAGLPHTTGSSLSAASVIRSNRSINNNMRSVCEECGGKFETSRDLLSHSISLHGTEMDKLASGHNNLVWVLYQDKAGLGVKNAKLLYMREANKEMLQHLDRNHNTRIEGPPGSGKSSLTWHWACETACRCDKRICWVHLSDCVVRVCFLEASKIWVENSLENVSNLWDILYGLQFDILIVDGITKKEDRTLLRSIIRVQKKSKASLILVTSAQYDLKEEEADIQELKHHTMRSWTKGEYTAALSVPAFLDSLALQDFKEEEGSESIQDLIENKYFYAGGCARWMFQFTIDKVMHKVTKYIRAASDSDKILQGLQGDRSVLAVNHLFMLDKDDNVFIISQFVSRELATKCDERFFREAAVSELALNNHAFDGWIFEASFLHRIRKLPMQTLTLSRAKHPPTVWNIGICKSYRDIHDLSLESLADNMCLLPKRWNQACYDMVQLLPNHGVRIVQVTRAATHSMKMKYARAMLEDLDTLGYGVQWLEVIIVVPAGHSFLAPRYCDGLGKYEDMWKISGERKYTVLEFQRPGMPAECPEDQEP